MIVKRNWCKFVCLSLVIVTIFVIKVSALEGSYTNFDKTGVCHFGPDTGTIYAYFYDDYVRTPLIFRYGDEDIEYITAYNGINQYAGVDIKNVPSTSLGTDMMSARTITTTLPDPYVTDLENDDLFGARNEEAEVVILGSITSGTAYSMTVYWDDYREGNSGDNGQWNVNAELSSRGVSDYNVDSWSSLASLTYGPTSGAT